MPVFQQGQEASKSAFVAALTGIQSTGAGVLNTLVNARVGSLIDFERRLQGINARRTRAWRVTAPTEAIKFVVSDFTDVDQANTTGTVRADSASVSLKERALPAQAVIKTKVFSTNKGTVEPLDATQTVFRVHTDDGSAPTGQFDIELVTPLSINHLIIDIVATPSSPAIVVSSSGDGLTYTQATNVALNGYRINAWLPIQEVRFVRLQITPSHPDTLNGTTFTFGITNFSAQATQYHLRSEFVTKTLTFAPETEFVVFDAAADPNVQYYLSINAVGSPAGPFIGVNPGDAVQVGTLVSGNFSTNVSFPSLIAALPSNVYFPSIQVSENGGPKRVAPGLTQSDPNIRSLINEYVGTSPTSLGFNLSLVSSTGVFTPPRTFAVSYVFGPPLVNVRLKVRLNTTDSNISPIFHGASLDVI